MEKPKREKLSPEMRSRLLTNRHGRLTADQWKDMVMEPLITLLVLLIPGVFILGPRLGALMVGGFWLFALTGLLAVVASLVFRAQRYARAPVHFAILNAGDDFQPFWMFWKPQVLYTEAGNSIHFQKRLSPHVRLQRGERYLVYYLKDAQTNVLLSLAPASHPDADMWQPTERFGDRFSRRSRG